jgi:hypothetical protein
MSKRSAALNEVLEEAALAGGREIIAFLGSSRKKDSPREQTRVKVGVAAVSGYTRWRASQNNMVTMMLMAARQVGVSPEQTLEICKLAGVLPESTERVPLKLAK